MRHLNAIFLLCRAERITLSAFARACDIDRTRAHRLAHMTPSDLRASLTVAEARRIADAFPAHPYTY